MRNSQKAFAAKKWQQKLLAEENLTYEKAYKLLLSLEASEKEVKDISSGTGSNSTPFATKML